MQDALAELETAQAEEAGELGAELEAAGYPERTRARATAAARGAAQARAPARADRALLEGITALETVYRDALAGSPTSALNARPSTCSLIVADARRRAALDACRDARQAHRRVQPERDAAARAPLPPPPAAGEAPTDRPSRAADPRRYTRRRAGVAQTAEQLTRNEQAKGSSPFSGSISPPRPGHSAGSCRARRYAAG